jgi:hypothetical protein
VQKLDALLQRLFIGENRDLRIASITFGVLRVRVTMAQKNALRAAIGTFEDHIQEGAAVQEAGDQNFRLHIRCMLHVLISRADSAADDLNSYLLKKDNKFTSNVLHSAPNPSFNAAPYSRSINFKGSYIMQASHQQSKVQFFLINTWSFISTDSWSFSSHECRMHKSDTTT